MFGLRRFSGRALALIALLLVVAFSWTAAAAPAQAREKGFDSAESNFRAAMRKLWEDHITWTRLYIVSAAADLPNTDPTAQRLLQNQVDIGNAIKPFYGEEAGDHLTALLTDHISIAVELIDAAKDGDAAAFEDARVRWYANADEIAVFLSSANPENWPEAEMKAQMRMHLDLTLEEAAAHLNGDWEADIAAYDQIHEHILELADVLALGIIEQFPHEFK